MKPSDFYTRSAANEGLKLPLSLPDGKKTDHYLIIRGVDSDAYKEAFDESVRQSLEMRDLAPDERKAQRKELTVALLASLVAGWSFEAEATPDAVCEFLREAPHIAEQIDRIAGDRPRFFGLKSAGSTRSPSPSSGSKKSRKALKQASAST